MRKILIGAIDNTIAGLEIAKKALSGFANEETKLNRREICLGCDEYLVKFNQLAGNEKGGDHLVKLGTLELVTNYSFNGVCGNCGCYLKPKTALIEFKCPLGKW